MRKTFLLILLFCANYLFAQNYEITFSCAGESSTVDSVRVHNINLSTSLSLPGSSTLHLVGPTTQIVSPLSSQGSLKVYPNPMTESATIQFIVLANSIVQIDIVDLQGKIIVREEEFLTRGEYSFEISGLNAGMYYVILTTSIGRNTAKLVSTADAFKNPILNLISHDDIEDDAIAEIKNIQRESSKNLVLMEYVDGNVLIFTAYSGINATVSSQIPTQSQNLTQNFVPCVDPDNYSYSIIEFNDQIWMAENLRFDNGCSEVEWIDSLDTGWCGYYSENQENLEEYGLLYQWSVANVVCPIGWRLPSDSDWSELEMFLGMDPYETNSQGLRGTHEGAKLAGTPLWQIGPLVEDSEFGITGFNGKPAGMRHFSGTYNFIESSEYFWSSSEYSSTQAWYRYFNYSSPKMGRYYYSGKSLGLSVRCIKDNTELTEYPIVETVDVTGISQNTAVVTGNVVSQGLSYVVQRGFVWSTEPDPSLVSNDGYLGSGIGAGTYFGTITGLEAGTVYYVRAFATNDAGTIYGNELSFETSPVLLVPTVITTDISGITNFTAISGGNVLDDGGSFVTTRGIVWGTNPGPTIEINFGITTNQTGLGEFVSQLELIPATTYYVRAYASNAIGTAYGNEMVFSSSQNQNCGFVEYHDYSYGTIQIGNQCWLTENLKFLPEVTGSANQSDSIPYYYVYQYTGNNIEEAKILDNYINYGVLYNWQAAITACPGGWHLPCDAEWQELEVALGMTISESEILGSRGINIGSKLAGESLMWANGQLDSNQFFDISGFRALPAGALYSWPNYASLGTGGYWWSDTENDLYAMYRSIGYSDNKIFRYQNPKEIGYSVRCVKDEINSDLPTVSTNQIINITQLSAGSGGNVEDNGGNAILAKGVVWSTASSPDLITNDGYSIDGACTGEFESNLINLQPETTYYARAYATNINGTAYGEEYSFATLALQLPDVTTSPVLSVSQYSATAGGSAINDHGAEVTSKGIVWGTNPNPTIDINIGFTVDGMGLGSFESYITGLDYATTYYVRAYATNSVGTSYGEQYSFQTLALMLPVVSTAEVEYITQTSALSGGVVSSDGGAEVTNRGVVWSQTQHPTVENNDGISIDGSGLGLFISSIEPLQSLTSYYVRSFATNIVGTSYGEEFSFETMSMGEDGLPCPGMDSVVYSGYSYPTIKFGNNCWFAENLRFLPTVGGTIASDSVPVYVVFSYNGTSVDAAMLNSYYLVHGVKYNYAAAIISCPGGWYVPSDNDWKSLEMNLGMTQIQADLVGLRGTYEGSKLAGNEILWTDGLLDADSRFGQSGFNALPGSLTSTEGSWWSSTVDTIATNQAYIRKISYSSTRTERNKAVKSYFSNVRCVKELYTPNAPVVSTNDAVGITETTAVAGGFISYDGGEDVISRGVVWSTLHYPTLAVNEGFTSDGSGIEGFESQITGLTPGTIYFFRAYATNSVGTSYGDELCMGTVALPPAQNPCFGYETVDYEGYTYNTVRIGTQCWLAENLRYLPSLTTIADHPTHSYKVYGYTGTSVEEAKLTDNYNTYGVLYNFNAAVNWDQSTFVSNSMLQGICPENWHIPTTNEVNALQTYLGGSLVAGGKLKEISTSHWQCPNIGATNESLFGALPGGNVYLNVSSEMSEKGMWWTSSYPSQTSQAYAYSTRYDQANFGMTLYSLNYYASVRCIRNLELPTVTTLEASDISQTLATLNGDVAIDGGSDVTERGIIWNLTDNLNMENYDGICSSGIGMGEFSCLFENLNYGTTYYYRAYAVNSVGLSYGEILSFETNTQANLPVVITISVDSITPVSAYFTGELTDDGGEPETIKGFVWSTSTNPTVENNEGIYYDSEGEGVYSFQQNDLYCNTSFYVRAFAINTGGTTYGNEISFNTLDVPACVPVFYDGYTYNTVQIGCQCWFEENLRYLPSVLPKTLNSSDSIRYYVYDNVSYDVEIAKSTECYNKYGVLYNVGAIIGACPDGWKVPSDHDWKILELYLGMSEDVVNDYLDRGTNEGSKLAGADSLWSYGSLTLDPEFNTSGFNALPGGYRNNSVSGLGYYSYFWSSTIDPDYEGHYLFRKLYKSQTTINRFNNEEDCYSIRCLKDLLITDTLPSVETISVSSITTESAILSGEVYDNFGEEASERGFVWNESGNPDITNNDGIVYCGYGDGEFTSEISGLSEGVHYYVSAFASNGLGTSYGTQLDFIANSDALPPIINIIQITDIDPISFVVESDVTSEGGSAVTERGVIWSKTENPTITDNLGSITNGFGLGSFNTSVEYLEDTAVYYVRSYAINSNGISYSNQFVVTTDTFENCGTYEYDDHLYKSVIIGNQCWFTEDLNETTYNWSEAVNACPVGWMLPSDADWIDLELELGMPPEDTSIIGFRGYGTGGKLAANRYFWSQDSLVNCPDFGSSGFKASHNTYTLSIDWWTSTVKETNDSYSYCRRLSGSSTSIYRFTGPQSNSRYVRCLRDTTVHLELPVVSTISSGNITQSTVILSGELSFEGIPTVLEKGFVISASSNPAINSYDVIVTIAGSLGVFEEQAIGLHPSTQYYYRAYAKNMIGVAYGNEYTFTTPQAATLPVITTDSITIVTQTNAQVYGTLIDDGGELGDVIQGFVLSTVTDPNIDNCDFVSDTIIGVGNFNGLLYSLDELTTYYVKAYAYNSTGITYGDEISFTTTAFPRCGTIGFQGYNYKTILIGSQCWMVENMRYLPDITYYNDWGTTNPEYIVFAYQGHSVETAMAMENYEIYGALYNWQAAMEICPVGWHLPSDDDYKTLELEIGMTSEEVENSGFRGTTEGSQLAGQMDLWLTDEYDELDKNTDFGKSGFSCLPSGYIDNSGIARNKGTKSFLWTSTHIDGNETYSYCRQIYRDESTIMRTSEANLKGAAVRCIRDVGFSNMVPTVFTHEVLNLEYTTEWQVQIGGRVTYDGCDSLQARGIVWSTTENPTLSDNSGFIVEGNGLGDFEVLISGLSEGVQYYYRAYATNSVGTSYGLQLSFITTQMVDGQPCPAAPYVIDVRDTTQYLTISFNNMCWFAENLRYLPAVVGVTDESTEVPKYYVYDYEGNDVYQAKQTENYLTYGVLYNWPAAMESCPANWYVPSDDDWKILEILTGMTSIQAAGETWRGTNEGSKLAGDSSMWNSGVLVDDPEFGVSGFNVLPGGSQTASQSFYSVGDNAFFWTSTATSSTSSFRRQRYFSKSETGIFRNIRPTDYGYSVRCVKSIQ